LIVCIPRLYCKDCGSIRQPHLTFAEPKKHYTRSLERFVIDLCRVMSIQDVAELTDLSWDTVKEIHKKHLRRKYRWLNLKKIGMVQFCVASSSAAWGWQSSKSGATIPKSFGFEAATPYRATNNVTQNLTYLNHARKSVILLLMRSISARNASTSPLFLIFEADGSFILAGEKGKTLLRASGGV
jgi:hypothetical protein